VWKKEDIMKEPKNLALLARQICDVREDNAPIPDELARAYVLEAGLADPGTHADSLDLQALALYRKGSYTEALTVFEQALRLYPFNIHLQESWRNMLNCVAAKIDTLGVRNPKDPEFGQTYEKLVALGVVIHTTHLWAIYHYYHRGLFDRAAAIALALHTVSPNLLGLAEAITLVAAQTDDVRLSRIATVSKESK